MEAVRLRWLLLGFHPRHGADEATRLQHTNEVLFLGFYLLPTAFTLWAFSPFFPQGKVQPLNDWPTQCSDQCNGMDEREVRWKVVSMMGADNEFS
jgi:hypothetical protein